MAKKKAQDVDIWEDSDEQFYFIAGYTSGGAAYGITWEEMALDPYEMPKDIGCDTDVYYDEGDLF